MMDKKPQNKEGEIIRTLIVDDEGPARKRIRELLNDRTDFEIVGESSNGESAINSISALSPDLVFLDIQLQDMDGFAVLDGLNKAPLPIVVFVTAYDEYALKAFNFHALDYLLKPFDDERFEETVQAVTKRLRQAQIEDLSEKLSGLIASYRKKDKSDISESGSFQNRLVVKSVGKVTFIETQDIDWISADGYYASIRVLGKSHLMRISLKKLEGMLNPNTFLRIHRSTIVNVTRIKELHSHFHGEFFVVLKDGKRFKLSRSYRKNAERLLGGRF